MDLAGIYHKANILIAQTYGITGVPVSYTHLTLPTILRV